MAAIVTDYTSFNAQLNRQIGADSDSEVAATIGRKLTIGGAWGEEMFSKSGAHVLQLTSLFFVLTGSALHNNVYIYTAVYSQTLTAISIFKYVNIVCLIQVHSW